MDALVAVFKIVLVLAGIVVVWILVNGIRTWIKEAPIGCVLTIVITASVLTILWGIIKWGTDEAASNKLVTIGFIPIGVIAVWLLSIIFKDR